MLVDAKVVLAFFEETTTLADLEFWPCLVSGYRIKLLRTLTEFKQKKTRESWGFDQHKRIES